MIVILKPGAQKARIESLMEQIKNQCGRSYFGLR